MNNINIVLPTARKFTNVGKIFRLKHSINFPTRQENLKCFIVELDYPVSSKVVLETRPPISRQYITCQFGGIKEASVPQYGMTIKDGLFAATPHPVTFHL